MCIGLVVVCVVESAADRTKRFCSTIPGHFVECQLLTASNAGLLIGLCSIEAVALLAVQAEING
jgi:hypothetical protein